MADDQRGGRKKPVDRIPVPVGDMSSPFFDVRFYSNIDVFAARSLGTTQGTALEKPLVGFVGNPLTATGLDQQKVLDDARLSNFITDVQVTRKNEGASSVALTLTPPFDDAVDLLKNQVLKTGSIFTLRYGYRGRGGALDIEAPLMVMKLRPPTFSLSSTSVTIALDGEDIFGSVLGQDEQRRVFRRGEGFPNDLSILEFLVVNRPTLSFDSSRVGPDSPSRAVRDFDTVQSESDYQFFVRICYENNLGWYQSGKDIIVFDRDEILLQPAIYTLSMFKQIESDYEIPISALTTDVEKYAFAAGANKSVQVYGSNLDGNLPLSKTFDATTDPVVVTQGTTTAAGDTSKGETILTDAGLFRASPPKNPLIPGKFISLPSELESREELGRRQMRDGARRAAQQVQLVAPGVPGLIATDNINLVTPIESINGLYYVQTAVHTLGMGGYTMTLQLQTTGQSNVPLGVDATVPVGRKVERLYDNEPFRGTQTTKAQPVEPLQ